MTKKLGIVILVALCVVVGLYPALYFLIGNNYGILSTKTSLLLNDGVWNIAFYTHISLGGLALLIGWTQFVEKFRKNNKNLHGNLNTVYMISVLFSGISGLFIATFATGGIVATVGFTLLSLIWLFTTVRANLEIKNGSKRKFRKYMTYSFAACLSAVTLRFWFPVLSAFITNELFVYRIVAWLCWVPNIVIAHFMVKSMNLKYVHS